MVGRGSKRGDGDMDGCSDSKAEGKNRGNEVNIDQRDTLAFQHGLSDLLISYGTPL